MNGLFDPKEYDEDYVFELSENAENPIIEIQKEFHFVSTCNTDKLKNLSPSLLNRLMVINLSNQLDNLKKEDFLDLIQIILENEYKEEDIDKTIIDLICESQILNNYSMSNLAKFAKSVYKLYIECKKEIDKRELIKYTHNLLFGEKIFNDIPRPIKNLLKNYFLQINNLQQMKNFIFWIQKV